MEESRSRIFIVLVTGVIIFLLIIVNPLSASATDGDGALSVSWVEGTGQWQGPAEKSPPNSFPLPGHVAMFKQTDDVLTALAVDNKGALSVSWVEGTGQWQGPVEKSKPKTFPLGAPIAMYKQTLDVLTALAVDNNGALSVSWVEGTGQWQGPVEKSPPNTFPLGAHVAMFKQTGNVLTALAVDNKGALSVSWVEGTGQWQGPKEISPTNTFPPGAPVAMFKQTDDVLTALAVDNKGALSVSWVEGTGQWQGPVEISPSNIFPLGAPVAMFKQTDDVLTALAVKGADSDGDGLPDGWEQNGIDFNKDGVIDLNLAAAGANPSHKDIFVEVDYMKVHRPYQQALNNVTDWFSRAPLTNPDGKPGITLHVEVDEEVGHQDTIGQVGFFSIKNTNFGSPSQRADLNRNNILAAKQQVYHYALFGHDQAETPGSSGITYSIPAMDFFISLGNGWTPDSTGHSVGSVDEQEGTFMHELGHSLGLRHGGIDGINCKPNYLSVMSYTRQLSDFIGNRPLDYSWSALNELDENALSEPTGISPSTPPGLITVYTPPPPSPIQFTNTGVPVDWNQNGNPVDNGVIADINNFNIGSISCLASAGEKLIGYDDWDNLRYFAGAQGSGSGAILIEPKKSQPDITSQEVKQIRLLLLDSINKEILALPNSSFVSPQISSEVKANITAQTSPITALLKSGNLTEAIVQLKSLRNKTDSSFGGSAADDLITSTAAQKRIVPLIDNFILVLEKQQPPNQTGNTTMKIPSNDNSNITNKSSSLNTTIPNELPPESVNGSKVAKI